MAGLHSQAWLIRGISGIPGELRLSSETLSFVATGTGSAWPFQLRKLAAQLHQPLPGETLEQGQPVQLFAWPVQEVVSHAPWFYFGGGINLRRGGVGLRISFGRPVGVLGDPGPGLAGLRELSAMRALGELWANALAEASRRGGAGPNVDE